MNAPRLIVCALAAAALLAAAVPAVAAASTEAQRARWVQTKPRVFSHGHEATPAAVCFIAGTYRADGGGEVAIDGAPCPDLYAPLPVHPAGRVLLRTPRNARAVFISPERAPLRRPCVKLAPGRWKCRLPDPREAAYTYLDIDYPGATAFWSFQVKRHPRERHAG